MIYSYSHLLRRSERIVTGQNIASGLTAIYCEKRHNAYYWQILEEE